MTEQQPHPAAGVLVIDDDPSITSLIRFMLKKDPVHVTVAHTIAEGIDAMRRLRPALVLLDYELPEGNGLDVLKRMRAEPELRRIPVIMATGSASDAVLPACFEAGADDYVRKPICAAELRARVRSTLEKSRLLAELQRVATHDALTGLPNRRLVMARLDEAIRARAADPTWHFAVLYSDFDGFKNVNDSLGHEVGDTLLKQIAGRFTDAIERSAEAGVGPRRAMAARLGGDEFVVLLEGVSGRPDVIAFADRLLEAFAAPYQLGGNRVHSSASVGICTSESGATQAADVLRDADTAMYEAKLAGRARYVEFDARMRERVRDRMMLEIDLRAAVEQERFVLEYQPIVCMRTGRLAGCEALVRWRHPTRGTILPGEFIPVAEETGLISPIGEWVLREACAQFMAWQREDGPAAPRSISVNLSRNQLVLPDLPGTIQRILRAAGMDPACLHVEITEGAAMKNVAVATTVLRQLKSVGIKVDIDDFGTGHSSLACLHQFPADVLKIDRSFVANLCRSTAHIALVQVVSQLAHNLKIEVVAEGIETPEQAAVLQSMDCEFGQGYLFAAPMSARAILQYQSTARYPVGEAARTAAA